MPSLSERFMDRRLPEVGCRGQCADGTLAVRSVEGCEIGHKRSNGIGRWGVTVHVPDDTCPDVSCPPVRQPGTDDPVPA